MSPKIRILLPTGLIFLHVAFIAKHVCSPQFWVQTLSLFFLSSRKIFLKSELLPTFSTTYYSCYYTCQNLCSLGCILLCFYLPLVYCSCLLLKSSLKCNTKALYKPRPSKKGRADLCSVGPYASKRKGNCWE